MNTLVKRGRDVEHSVLVSLERRTERIEDFNQKEIRP
jgi:hypothetical protein